MIIRTAPPNFDKLEKAFPASVKPGVIFAYGEDIYTLGSADIPYWLMAHESVHQQRQLDKGVELWWDLYIADWRFRYHEELLAHAAEYQSQIRGGSRNLRRVLLKATARRLASPLYRYPVTVEQATADLKKQVA